MAVLLKNIYSIINNKRDAKDNERAFTFIEFIKEFGYDNSTSSFINDYKTYLSQWASIKAANNVKNDDKFIRQNLIETLKSIVLTYSSYEEQDFIANIDWDNESHRRAIVPFFAEKIKNICDFYKAKRQEAPLIVNKNKFKGSKVSLEQIIFDKIIDFYFDNKNLKPQIAELQHNLSISIEQYVDIFSDYFDIPRNKKSSDKTRNDFLSANINTPNYEDYIAVSKVISDLLFNGEVYLEEIPLVAQVGLDLSQKCAGDAATLRDVLLNNATINLVSLNDQIALRRKLYQKYLGCDLYYIYCDTKDNVYIDVLTKADNPSGNLLNCGNADTATVEADKIKLLSHIGLFFKPDKTGILKINADNFNWEIDKTKLSDETFYVFPDPNKYGDIGNNKSSVYPLIYEYKLDSYIKNISSGLAKDEPLVYLSGTTWNSYYSAQDRDYILNKNKDYNYSFTSLANKGIIENYQVDIFGNEYGLIKGYSEDDNAIYVPSKYKLPEVKYIPGGSAAEKSNPEHKNILLNGGYYEEPYDNKPFPHSLRYRLADDYIWAGMSLRSNNFTTPDHIIPSLAEAHIDLGNFSNIQPVKYKDHYGINGFDIENTRNENIKNHGTTFASDFVNNKFTTSVSLGNKKIIVENKSFDSLRKETGTLWFKQIGKMPVEFGIHAISGDDSNNSVFLNGMIKNYSVIGDTIIVECENNLLFLSIQPGTETKFFEVGSIAISSQDAYKVLYNETTNKALIAIINQVPASENASIYSSINLKIYSFDPDSKKVSATPILNTENLSAEVRNNFTYKIHHAKIDDFVFTYNNNLDIYLLSYMFMTNGSPYIYEHQFKLYNNERFEKTLKSCVYYEKDNKSQTYLYNKTLTSSSTAYTTFFDING